MNKFCQPSPVQVLRFIEIQQWTFAKTMPKNPHEYIVRDRVKDDSMFNAFVAYIRRYGRTGNWGKQLYYYLQVGPHLYWSMGAPVEATTIVNRRKEPWLLYDQIAEQYNLQFTQRQYLAEDEGLWSILRDAMGNKALTFDRLNGKVLEVGCGAGNFLRDNHPWLRSPDDYLGFDPSAHMMAQADPHLPIEFKRNMVVCRAQDFRLAFCEYDYLFSFYGSANYVDLATWMRLLAYHSGRLFLMLYRPDYKPVYETLGDLTQGQQCTWQEIDRAVGNIQEYKTAEYGNYKIIIR